MKTAIMVDWALYKSNPYTQDFVAARADHAKFVLLVTDPDEDTATPAVPSQPDWDVLIRNTGKLPNVAFKATAYSVISEVSDLEVVIALDANKEINAMYREGGVLITVEDI